MSARSRALADSAAHERAAFHHADAAAYIASLSGDRAVLAREHGLDTFGYLLDMARLEAENESGFARARSDPE